MKKVSVIIPCYNASKWLPKCFLSLSTQTIGINNIEIIFVDDASTDDGVTWGLLQEFEHAFPQSVMIIRLKENMRQGGARNVALQYASGEYIAFVDADDFVADNFLKETYERAKNTNADIVQFNFYYYTDRLGAVPNKNKIHNEVISVSSRKQRKDLLISEKVTYGCWNKIYRRELIELSGVHYAEHVIYEEPLFVYPLLYYANIIVLYDQYYYFYRQNSEGTMYKDMEKFQTLCMHADVQQAVWEFMKRTSFFEEYYEEIKMYFLHTFLFETLYFAKERQFCITVEQLKPLVNYIKKEVPDYTKSPYEALIPLQMELYQLIDTELTQTKLNAYMDKW